MNGPGFFPYSENTEKVPLHGFPLFGGLPKPALLGDLSLVSSVLRTPPVLGRSPGVDFITINNSVCPPGSIWRLHLEPPGGPRNRPSDFGYRWATTALHEQKRDSSCLPESLCISGGPSRTRTADQLIKSHIFTGLVSID